MLQVAVLAKEEGALPSLIISNLFEVFQLATECSLQVEQLAILCPRFLKETKQIGILNSKFLLLSIKIIQGAIGFIPLHVKIQDLTLHCLVGLLSIKIIQGAIG